MRIIAGRFRGRPLRAPKGETTRPTTDRVRSSVFNLLYARMDMRDAMVLDLFSGTGALGLESISRGAKSAVMVDQSRMAIQYAKQNAETFGISDQCWFHLADSLAFAKRYRGPKFDVIFADPPYDLPDLPNLPELLFPLLKEDGWLVLEHDSRHFFDEHPALETCRPYGRTIVSMFHPALLAKSVEEIAP